MTEAAAIELRVLSGPHAGCRLPLAAGLYRAGADESCDIVLEGMSAGEVAFVLYVGRNAIALESLADGVSIDGKAASGLRELRPGQVFEFATWLFAVDEADSPWPDNPESLRRGAAPDVEADRHDLPELPENGVPAPTPVEMLSGDPAIESAASAPDSPVAAADAVAAKVQRRARGRLPFWMVGLIGTAAFLGCGVLALALTLAPARPAAVAEVSQVPDALARIAEAVRPNGDVQLEQLPGGRYRLSGYIATRLQRTALTREARSVEPMVLIRIIADEDLQSQAHDTLARFPGDGVELGGVKLGRMTLKGHVVNSAVRDKVIAAIRDGVPGVRSLDSEISASDDALVALRSLLATAGLADKIAARLDDADGYGLVVMGTPDAAAREAWSDVRSELVAKLGDSVEIVERFEAPVDQGKHPKSRSRDGVVAVVMGSMPYVLMENGTKIAGPPAKEEQ